MAESGKSGRGTSMNVDTRLVRELAELLSETGLTEIEVEDGDRKIKVSRGAAGTAQPLQVPAIAVAAPLAPTAGRFGKMRRNARLARARCSRDEDAAPTINTSLAQHLIKQGNSR